MEYYIIVFKNTNDAMVSEKKLKELNYDFKIMPTPTYITQSCGMCIRINDKTKINEILNNTIITFKSIYFKDNNSYKELTCGESFE